MDKQRGKWGSNQILNWIESNVESGRSEASNMEQIIQRDTNENYPNTNNEHRARITRKLGNRNQTVFMGGKSSKSFLLPIVEEGTINNIRKRFGTIIDAEEHQKQLQQQNMINLQFTHNDEGARNNYSHSHLNLEQSPSKLSFMSHRNENWNDDFINKVDQLKK